MRGQLIFFLFLFSLFLDLSAEGSRGLIYSLLIASFDKYQKVRRYIYVTRVALNISCILCLYRAIIRLVIMEALIISLLI